MVETLGNKQARFLQMFVQLVLFCNSQTYTGDSSQPLYRVRFGDAYRDPRATFPYGRPGSLHGERLAVDLMLDIWNGRRWVWQETTEAYKQLGEYWESIGGSWGGRFDDGNHFSLAHAGRR